MIQEDEAQPAIARHFVDEATRLHGQRSRGRHSRAAVLPNVTHRGMTTRVDLDDEIAVFDHADITGSHARAILAITATMDV